MEAKREQLVRERIVELEFKISRLGMLGKAYYELAQIKLRRQRNEIRVSRTQNMLLHAALQVLREKARIARRNAGDLESLRQTLVAQRLAFNAQKDHFFKRQDHLAKQLSDTHSAQLEMEWQLDPNTPHLLRIRWLERKLTLTLFKLNDMKILLKHYEGLLKPMKEHNSYAAKLGSVRIIVDIKNMECEKLIQTYHDAIRARDDAKRELEELLVSIGAYSRKVQHQIPADLQARILRAIAEIKEEMGVSSMREMYRQYLLQEKQTAYLDQIYVEMRRTRDQLKGPAQRRRSSLPKPELHNMVQETRQMVRRQSERNPSLRRDSIPLFQIIDGTKNLVDKLHEGTTILVEGDVDSLERQILMSCEDRLTDLLKALNRKLKHVERVKKEREEYEAMSDAEKRAFDEGRMRWADKQEKVHDAAMDLREAQAHARQLADKL